MSAKKGAKIVQCQYCPKKVATQKGLRSHMGQVHPDKPLAESVAAPSVPAAEAAIAPVVAEPEDVASQPHAHKDGIDGEYTHAHPWGDHRHSHRDRQGPPMFEEEAEHPDIVAHKAVIEATEGLLKDEKPDEVKDKEHERALAAARDADREAMKTFPPVGDEEPDLVLHCLKDGFTVLGKVFYYGEDIKLRKGSDAYKSTVDRNGFSWTTLTTDEQLSRWGEVRFARGPFKKTTSTTEEEAYFVALNSSDPDALQRHEKNVQRGMYTDAPLAKPGG